MNTVQPVINLKSKDSDEEQKKYLQLAIVVSASIGFLGLFILMILFIILSQAYQPSQIITPQPPPVSNPISSPVSFQVSSP